MAFQKGKLISVEGIEGAGKSTAMQFIQRYLSEHTDVKIFLTREPGGTPLAEHLRDLILHPKISEPLLPQTELLLLFAGRVQHLHQVIIPHINAGTWVITDRFIDATYAYQGGGRALNPKFIETLDNFIVGDYYPDLTLLLDISPELGLVRTEQRQKKDRIEQEHIDFFASVRATYLERAAQAPQRIKKIDASESIEHVEQQLSQVLNQFLQVQT